MPLPAEPRTMGSYTNTPDRAPLAAMPILNLGGA
ncbi:hypothetical protein LAUMK22_04512 [Mycobacterium kansasii]|uniref:Uncharacterized protein n=1 Tax=Mycobacterium persicum TaxID=1487726 RepID=A0AB38UZK9_9MYCO|nr:hypothetical protein LAUMK22_04512 [Mycobacterium kansasii]VAZ85840.1 hypothetical protein LAUMK42_04678 [Mycobacterium persicum]